MLVFLFQEKLHEKCPYTNETREQRCDTERYWASSVSGDAAI